MKRFVLLLALVVLPCPSTAEDAGPPTPRTPVVEAGRPSDGQRTMRGLPANVGRGLVGVLHPDNLGPLLAGGAAAATASFFDGRAREAMTDQLSWSGDLETAGGPLWSSVFVAGMFTAGRFTAGGGRFRAMTYDLLDAAVVNGVYTAAIKGAVGRERPDGSDRKSFPSGHTSNAFAMATVAARHYGWKIGVPAYAVAGLVGASRLREDRHWLSDVVAGATLGYVAGVTVVRVNARGAERVGATLSIQPLVARETRGVQVFGTF